MYVCLLLSTKSNHYAWLQQNCVLKTWMHSCQISLHICVCQEYIHTCWNLRLFLYYNLYMYAYGMRYMTTEIYDCAHHFLGHCGAIIANNFLLNSDIQLRLKIINWIFQNFISTVFDVIIVCLTRFPKSRK